MSLNRRAKGMCDNSFCCVCGGLYELFISTEGALWEIVWSQKTVNGNL